MVPAESPKRSADTANRTDGSGWRIHLPFLCSAIVCVVAFGWMLTFGTGRLFEADSLGNFYDYQAQSLLHGRWDVPEAALSGEAFVVAGKYYGYFGPTPALQRLPFVAAGVAFGRMTRLMMLADYALCLIGAYLLLRYAARRTNRFAPKAGMTIGFILAVGLGSTLFFLSSRAYVYHEAILCGAAFGLLGTWCALEYLDRQRTRWGLGALACGVLAVQARPPIGLFALTCIGVAAAWHLWRALHRDESAEGGRRSAGALPALGIGIGSVLGVLSFNAVAYAKFGTFDGCPLKYHIQYTPQRLAAIDGRNFHVANLRFNADSYFWRSNVHVSAHFPYVFVDYLNRLKDYPESKIDYRDPTLALPYAMPALVFLATIALVVGLLRPTPVRPTVVLLCISAVPFTVALLMAIAVTQRYTGDFCPFLIAMGAVGVSLIGGLEARLKIACVAVLIASLGVGTIVEAAMTLHTQRAVVWGVPADLQQQYRTWQHRIDAWFGVEASSAKTPTP